MSNPKSSGDRPPTFKSVFSYEARSKEEKDRLQWLFDTATKLRRDKGLPPTPESNSLTEPTSTEINKDWSALFDACVRAQLRLVFFHQRNYPVQLSLNLHFWMADQMFARRCKFVPFPAVFSDLAQVNLLPIHLLFRNHILER